jgi:excinuclease UvrABC helicase subunit UvrB
MSVYSLWYKFRKNFWKIKINFNKKNKSMFNWREFDRMMDEMFNTPMSNRGWDKKTYRSPDGSISYTYMTRGINNEHKNNELELLKHKLEVAIEKQEFEEAVELRDKIKSLEKNKEKISELQSKLDECVKKQEFEKAIEYRNKIKALN